MYTVEVAVVVHSGGKAVNPGSASAEPSHKKGNLSLRYGCGLGPPASGAALKHGRDRASDRNAGSLQVASGGFAPNLRGALNPSQRPAKPPNEMTCCFFSSLKTFTAGGYPPATVYALGQLFRWPVFRCTTYAGFGCPPRHDVMRHMTTLRSTVRKHSG